MNDISFIIAIGLTILILVYPVVKLAGKAWFKAYYQELTNTIKGEKNGNKG
jgi:hypothetical protein